MCDFLLVIIFLNVLKQDVYCFVNAILNIQITKKRKITYFFRNKQLIVNKSVMFCAKNNVLFYVVFLSIKSYFCPFI